MADDSMTLKRATETLGLGVTSTTEERQRLYQEKRALLERKISEAPTPGLQARYRRAIDLLTSAYETLEFAATEHDLQRVKREGTAAAGEGGLKSRRSAKGARRSARDFILAQVIVVALAVVLGTWRWKVSRQNAEVARLAAVAKAEADRVETEKAAAERVQREEQIRQETAARAARIEAERVAAAERVRAQQQEEERLRDAERLTRSRLVELETQFEGLDQRLKEVDRAIADQKSAERDLAKSEGWLLEWAQRRRSLLEAYRAWLGDFATRHPARVRMRTASQFLQGHDIDAAAAAAAVGVDEWARLAGEPERRRYTDVGRALIDWVIGPKEGAKEILERLQLEESAAVARMVADLRGELAYLDDRAKKPVFSDLRGRLQPLAWLAGANDPDVKRWRPRFVSSVRIVTKPAGADVLDERGQALGVTPLAMEVPRGVTMKLTARLPGFVPAAVTAEAGADLNDREVQVTLHEIALPTPQQPFTVPEVGLTLVWIEPGSFLMGSPASEPERLSDEGPQVKVALTSGFWLGKYEVTQTEWLALMGNNPSLGKEAGPNAPVENISWKDAMEYCRRLTEHERQVGRLPAGFEYTLPTEAQWEYACRAGTTGGTAGPLEQMGWYGAPKTGSTHPVGQKQPNAWGLYDMHGNVWEWCRDWYADGYRVEAGATLQNPSGKLLGSYRVNRGGSWTSPASKCRSAFRNWLTPNDRGAGLGFRVALTRP